MINEGGIAPPFSTDELEAESCKYSDRVAIILPLTSGAFACFNAQRKILGITQSMETLMLMVTDAKLSVSAPQAGPSHHSRVKLSLDDLDLF